MIFASCRIREWIGLDFVDDLVPGLLCLVAQFSAAAVPNRTGRVAEVMESTVRANATSKLANVRPRWAFVARLEHETHAIKKAERSAPDLTSDYSQVYTKVV